MRQNAFPMADKTAKVSMDKLESLCKRRGFIFQSSDIYGGLSGFWDYGPLGCELKRNIREAWWQDIVRERANVVGLDCSIIMHPRTWEASGHTTSFVDPMVDCKSCKKRYKADALTDEQGGKLVFTEGALRLPEGVKCPACGSRDLTEPRSFNLMFKTFVGPLEDESAVVYLRPETAQGIFAQFSNVLSVSRQKIPFGIAQIGKAFRNEINPRNYTFRSREFEQMELEFFVKPGTDQQWHDYWVQSRLDWYRTIGLPEDALGKYVYDKNELAHYASACVDITYAFPFGAQELEGIAARGAFDLTRHQESSGKSMEYFDQESNQKFIPHVVEPSAGVDRIALAVLCEAYCEEYAPKAGMDAPAMPCLPGSKPPDGYEQRVLMRFSPRVAPVKVAVFPLLKNKPELVEKAKKIYDGLKMHWSCFLDEVGAIGRRYRRQDEIGTPCAITVDFDTLNDDTVTLRDRDTMKQERIGLSEVTDKLRSILDAG